MNSGLTYLLDTNACIRLLNGTSAALAAQLARRSPNQIRLSAVVKAELLLGARKSRRVQENLQLLARFFAPFQSVPFDDLTAEHYGAIRAELSRAGTLIGPNDLLIGATARAHDLVLVTANVGEFSRIVGLRLEDWERESPGR
jgi:tRNA(fMet)-specific endonuclease VapC